jgi:hypothetical protein
MTTTKPSLRARRIGVLLSAVPALLLATAASAEGPAIGLRGGTLGIGPEVTFGFTKAVHLRLGAFVGEHGEEVTQRGIDYDADVELRNLPVLLDWHPGGGGFRLSAGAVWNDSEVVGKAPLEDLLRREIPNLPLNLPFDIGTLRGTATVAEIGPYLGVGFGNPFRGGRWGFTLDVGAVYQGEPDVDLVAQTGLPIGIIPGGQAALERALREEEAALEDEIDSYVYLPVISIGFTYSF